MQRDLSSLMHVVLRFLTVAITLVVGVRVGPQVVTGAPPTSAVSLTDQTLCEDAARPEPRAESRSIGGPAVDRLPPAAPLDRPTAPAPVEIADVGHVVDIRSRAEQRPIVKHVPRMERGDPPRA